MTRQIQARLIMSEPEKYAVCCACGSISRHHNLRWCVGCHGYKFATDAPAVIKQALALAVRKAESVLREDLG